MSNTADIRDKIEQYLYNYLKDFKFITYQFSNIDESFIKLQDNNILENDNNSSIQNVNVVICVEMKCLIIKKIEFPLIIKVIKKIEEEKHSQIINVSNNFKQSMMNTKEEKEIKEEIDNFVSHFQQEIKKNNFLQSTIRPISGFLIRRYFFPTDYFDDPSFFTFGEACVPFEEKIRSSFIQALFSKGSPQFDINFVWLLTYIDEFQYGNNKAIKKHEFQANEFVILRELNKTDKAFFYLVIHLESLYIFMMKKIQKNERIIKEIKHEKYFCKNYSHRCMTKFYGFVKEKRKTIGLIYEFLCNGSLKELVEKQPKKVDGLYKIMTLVRLYRGIEYLHMNSLIHRDLKPSNILIDHDYLPYISDFDEICHFNSEVEKQSNEEMTNDIGNIYYTSPEQDQGEILSSSTDIYSFGMIIYYLYEKKDNDSKNKKKIKLISSNLSISNKMQYLYKSCVKYNPKERINHKEIESILIDEIDSISFFERYLVKETSKYFTLNLMHLLESIYVLTRNVEQITKFCIKIINYLNVNCNQKDNLKAKDYYELSFKQNNSNALNNLGILYYEGYEVKQDYLKAKKYFELSAKENNLGAFNNLGILYHNGYGVKKDYFKAKECYELCLKQNNNSYTLYNLGNLYYYGIKQDYLKAKEYYQSSATQDNSYALGKLGDLYFYGHGVKQDYLKAKEYYELSAKQNNARSLFQLGFLYYNGYGVDKDYWKAKKYYELSSKQNDSYALINLGILYIDGYIVKKDYLKAKECFELSLKQNNSSALIYLGILYCNGYGVKQDYLKAKEYFESSLEQNNNPIALNYLGTLYEIGYLFRPDYLKAKEYYELASKHNDSYALFNLGYLYEKGYGVKQDYLMAIQYYELSSKHRNPNALYNLGKIYSNKKKFINLSKAIKCFTKCYEIYVQKIETMSLDQDLYVSFCYNYYRYQSANNLGLIYLICFQDIEKSVYYIKESAFGEFPFGQNNFGLLNQFFLDNFQKAEHFYERSSEHNFALAEFNLGRMRELQGREEESIDYYIKALHYKRKRIFPQDDYDFDKRLEISKKFIICLTNFKLSYYYLLKSCYISSKEYFIESFSCFDTFRFQFNMNGGDNIFSYLKSFVLLSPLFNLMNQPFQEIIDYLDGLNLDTHNIIWYAYSKESKTDKCKDWRSCNKSVKYENHKKQSGEKEKIKYAYETKEQKFFIYEKKRYISISKLVLQLLSFVKNNQNFIFKKVNCKPSPINKEKQYRDPKSYFNGQGETINKISLNKSLLFTDPESLFDFIFRGENKKEKENAELKENFINEIRDIINCMETILYIPPYPILFGRIDLNKPKSKPKPVFYLHKKDINNIFYEGFGIEKKLF